MLTFTAETKHVAVYPAAATAPIVYMNAVSDSSAALWQSLQQSSCPDCSLVVISNLNWNDDMTPWPAPPIAKSASPCTGGADDYLPLLLHTIIPQAERLLPYPPSRRVIAGYSLAGLFALYALYQTDVFSCAASMSGSLWYPGFASYVSAHPMKRKPDFIYLSLGTKEKKTRNPLMQTIQMRTEEIERYYHAMGIRTVLEMNEGNHFKDVVKRITAGICCVVSHIS